MKVIFLFSLAAFTAINGNAATTTCEVSQIQGEFKEAANGAQPSVNDSFTIDLNANEITQPIVFHGVNTTSLVPDSPLVKVENSDQRIRYFSSGESGYELQITIGSADGILNVAQIAEWAHGNQTPTAGLVSYSCKTTN